MASFTARGVESKTRPGYHADPDHEGLYLQVTQAKAGIKRSWVFRYTSPVTGKRREMGLGTLKQCSLAKVRDQARGKRDLVRAGKDPLEEKRIQDIAATLERSRMTTFDQAAERCIAAKKPEWRNAKHADQWTNTLRTYATPILGNIPVQQIDTTMVLRVLEPIWTTKTETASRVRQRIETVIDFCKARGEFQGDNPARLNGHLSELLPRIGKIQRVRHHPALPYVQLHAFVLALRKQGGVTAMALEFLIMTAARTGEVIGARWEEIDWEHKIWTIPPERMKAGRRHRVPLNDRALEILTKLQKTAVNEFVFPGHSTKPHSNLSNAAMLSLMKDMADFASYTPHGFRSTFRDWCAERTNYPSEVVEMALAHTIENRVEAAYRRGDLLEKRARLMADWNRYTDTPVDKARVVSLQEQRA